MSFTSAGSYDIESFRSSGHANREAIAVLLTSEVTGRYMRVQVTNNYSDLGSLSHVNNGYGDRYRAREIQFAYLDSIILRFNTQTSVASVSIDTPTGGTNLRKGQSLVLSATVLPNNSYQLVRWTSSDSNVATVNAITGEVTALGTGTVTITARSVADGNLSSTLSLTVMGADGLFTAGADTVTRSTFSEADVNNDRSIDALEGTDSLSISTFNSNIGTISISNLEVLNLSPTVAAKGRFNLTGSGGIRVNQVLVNTQIDTLNYDFSTTSTSDTLNLNGSYTQELNAGGGGRKLAIFKGLDTLNITGGINVRVGGPNTNFVRGGYALFRAVDDVARTINISSDITLRGIASVSNQYKGGSIVGFQLTKRFTNLGSLTDGASTIVITGSVNALVEGSGHNDDRLFAGSLGFALGGEADTVTFRDSNSRVDFGELVRFGGGSDTLVLDSTSGSSSLTGVLRASNGALTHVTSGIYNLGANGNNNHEMGLFSNPFTGLETLRKTGTGTYLLGFSVALGEVISRSSNQYSTSVVVTGTNVNIEAGTLIVAGDDGDDTAEEAFSADGSSADAVAVLRAETFTISDGGALQLGQVETIGEHRVTRSGSVTGAVTINSGGRLDVEAGGSVTGTVTVSSGGILDIGVRRNLSGATAIANNAGADGVSFASGGGGILEIAYGNGGIVFSDAAVLDGSETLTINVTGITAGGYLVLIGTGATGTGSGYTLQVDGQANSNFVVNSTAISGAIILSFNTPTSATSVSIDTPAGGTSISLGSSVTLTARVAPESSNGGVVWTSSDEAKATVNAVTGEVTALGTGTVRITATSVADGSLTDTLDLTIGDLFTAGADTVTRDTFGDADRDNDNSIDALGGTDSLSISTFNSNINTITISNLETLSLSPTGSATGTFDLTGSGGIRVNQTLASSAANTLTYNFSTTDTTDRLDLSGSYTQELNAGGGGRELVIFTGLDTLNITGVINVRVGGPNTNFQRGGYALFRAVDDVARAINISSDITLRGIASVTHTYRGGGIVGFQLTKRFTNLGSLTDGVSTIVITGSVNALVEGSGHNDDRVFAHSVGFALGGADDTVTFRNSNSRVDWGELVRFGDGSDTLVLDSTSGSSSLTGVLRGSDGGLTYITSGIYNIDNAPNRQEFGFFSNPFTGLETLRKTGTGSYLLGFSVTLGESISRTANQFRSTVTVAGTNVNIEAGTLIVAGDDGDDTAEEAFSADGASADVAAVLRAESFTISEGGALQLGQTETIGEHRVTRSGSVTGAVTINSGGRLDVEAGGSVTGTVTVSSGGILDIGTRRNMSGVTVIANNAGANGVSFASGGGGVLEIAYGNGGTVFSDAAVLDGSETLTINVTGITAGGYLVLIGTGATGTGSGYSLQVDGQANSNFVVNSTAISGGIIISFNTPTSATSVSIDTPAGGTSISLGSSVTLTARVAPESSNGGVVWTSSDEAKATVNAVTGEVTALGTGTVRITATSIVDGSLTDTLDLTIGDLFTAGADTVTQDTFGDADSNNDNSIDALGGTDSLSITTFNRDISTITILNLETLTISPTASAMGTLNLTGSGGITVNQTLASSQASTLTYNFSTTDTTDRLDLSGSYTQELNAGGGGRELAIFTGLDTLNITGGINVRVGGPNTNFVRGGYALFRAVDDVARTINVSSDITLRGIASVSNQYKGGSIVGFQLTKRFTNLGSLTDGASTIVITGSVNALVEGSGHNDDRLFAGSLGFALGGEADTVTFRDSNSRVDFGELVRFGGGNDTLVLDSTSGSSSLTGVLRGANGGFSVVSSGIYNIVTPNNNSKQEFGFFSNPFTGLETLRKTGTGTYLLGFSVALGEVISRSSNQYSTSVVVTGTNVNIEAGTLIVAGDDGDDTAESGFSADGASADASAVLRAETFTISEGGALQLGQVETIGSWQVTRSGSVRGAVTINSGGRLDVGSGGSVTGTVTVSSGGILDIGTRRNLSGATAIANNAGANGVSFASGGGGVLEIAYGNGGTVFSDADVLDGSETLTINVTGITAGGYLVLIGTGATGTGSGYTLQVDGQANSNFVINSTAISGAIILSFNTVTTSVSIDTPTGGASLSLGSRVTLTARVAGEGSNGGVVWSSSDEAKATVNAVTGVVTALGAGMVRITARSIADGSLSDTLDLTVLAGVDSLFTAGNDRLISSTFATADGNNDNRIDALGGTDSLSIVTFDSDIGTKTLLNLEELILSPTGSAFGTLNLTGSGGVTVNQVLESSAANILTYNFSTTSLTDTLNLSGSYTQVFNIGGGGRELGVYTGLDTLNITADINVRMGGVSTRLFSGAYALFQAVDDVARTINISSDITLRGIFSISSNWQGGTVVGFQLTRSGTNLGRVTDGASTIVITGSVNALVGGDKGYTGAVGFALGEADDTVTFRNSNSRVDVGELVRFGGGEDTLVLDSTSTSAGLTGILRGSNSGVGKILNGIYNLTTGGVFGVKEFGLFSNPFTGLETLRKTGSGTYLLGFSVTLGEVTLRNFSTLVVTTGTAVNVEQGTLIVAGDDGNDRAESGFSADGASADATAVLRAESFTILDGGTLQLGQVETIGGNQVTRSGSVRGAVAINDGGRLDVTAGGGVTGAVAINRGGRLALTDGGSVTGAVAINDGGILDVTAGGSVTEKVTVASGGVVDIGARTGVDLTSIGTGSVVFTDSNLGDGIVPVIQISFDSSQSEAILSDIVLPAVGVVIEIRAGSGLNLDGQNNKLVLFDVVGVARTGMSARDLASRFRFDTGDVIVEGGQVVLQTGGVINNQQAYNQLNQQTVTRPVVVTGAVTGDFNLANADIVLRANITGNIRANNITLVDAQVSGDLVLNAVLRAGVLSIVQTADNAVGFGDVDGGAGAGDRLEVSNDASSDVVYFNEIRGFEQVFISGLRAVRFDGEVSDLSSLTNSGVLILNSSLGTVQSPIALVSGRLTINRGVGVYTNNLTLSGDITGEGDLFITGEISGSGVVNTTGTTTLGFGVTGAISFGDGDNNVVVEDSRYSYLVDGGAGSDSLRASHFANLNFQNFEKLIIAGGEYDVTDGLESGLESLELSGGRLVVEDSAIFLNELKASRSSQIEVTFAGDQFAQITLASGNNLSSSDAANITVFVSGITATDLPTSSDDEEVSDIILRGATSVANGTQVRVRVSEDLNLANEVFIRGEFNNGNLVLIYTFGGLTNIEFPVEYVDLEDDRRALVDLQRGATTSEEKELIDQIVLLAQSRQVAQAGKRLAQIMGTNTALLNNQVTTVSKVATSFAGARAVAVGSGKGGVNGPDNIVTLSGFNVWVDFGYTSGELHTVGVNSGYELEGYATRAGIDAKFSDFVLGFALSYSDSDVATNDGDVRTDIDTTTFTTYTSSLREKSSFNNILSLSFSNVDYTRLAGTSGDTFAFVLDIDSSLRLVRKSMVFGDGFTYSFGYVAGARFIHSLYRDIRERGTLALLIEGESNTSLFVNAGANWAFSWEDKQKRKHSLSLDIVLGRDLADVSRDASARFVSGNTPFVLSGIEESRNHLNTSLQWNMVKGRDTLGLGINLNHTKVGSSSNFNIKLKRDF